MEQEAVTSLASAFQQLEKCKSDFNVEDYSLSQTTLEQVGTIVLFLDFLLWCWRTQIISEQIEIDICDNCTFPWLFAANHTDHPWTRWDEHVAVPKWNVMEPIITIWIFLKVFIEFAKQQESDDNNDEDSK